MAIDGVTGRLNSFFFGRMYMESIANPYSTSTIEWCQKAGLLAKSGIKCPKCHQDMELKRRCDCGDKFEWLCQRDKHKHNRSIRKGTMFENSKLPICKILMIVWHWVNDLTLQQVINEMDVASGTAFDWFRFCREVCVDACLRTIGNKIGGEERTVEIEESELGARNSRGGNRVQGKWVLCGLERESDNWFMVAVSERTKAMLSGVIRERILPGTTIVTNCLAAYDVSDESLEDDYQIVPLTDPEPVARKRNSAKRSRPSVAEFDPHLAETLWRRSHNIEIQRMFLAFVHEIAQIYNPVEAGVSSTDQLP